MARFLRIFSFFALLLFIPCAGWSAGRGDGGAMIRGGNGASKSPVTVYSFYKNIFARAQSIQRPTQQNPGQTATRGVTNRNSYTINRNTSEQSEQKVIINNKQDYIAYLKNGHIGRQSDCLDKYNKYTAYFNDYSPNQDTIGIKANGANVGRLDTICDFIDSGHWCFVMGYAYAIRDPKDPERVGKGYRCYTYQEFCNDNKKGWDEDKTNAYLSQIIEEIYFYISNIRYTDKNIVSINTEKKSSTGTSYVTDTKWKTYNTDIWVGERISKYEMINLLCK